MYVALQTILLHIKSSSETAIQIFFLFHVFGVSKSNLYRFDFKMHFNEKGLLWGGEGGVGGGWGRGV